MFLCIKLCLLAEISVDKRLKFVFAFADGDFAFATDLPYNVVAVCFDSIVSY